MAQTRPSQLSPSEPDQGVRGPDESEGDAAGSAPSTESGVPAAAPPHDAIERARRSEISTVGGAVRVAVLRDGDGHVVELQGIDEVTAARGQNTSTWIDMASPSKDQVEAIAKLLGLHELIAEDIVEGNQRSKIEITNGVVHIVMFALTYGADVSACEIDIILGEGFLLTVHGPDWDPRASHHLRSGLEQILRRGPDHLLWALVDSIVDGYFPLLDRMGDEIDELEDAVVRKATPPTLERLFTLKRELLSVRRAVAPVREIFNQLTNRELALIDPDEVIYFRDVYDHLIRLTDELDIYRELVSGTLEVYLSQVNNNLSLIMKRLTGVTVVVAGIGAIAGIFGMSEAGTALAGVEAGGFWIVTAFTVALALAAAAFLRRIDWI